jgi:lipopolysaccharide transport protein LptA
LALLVALAALAEPAAPAASAAPIRVEAESAVYALGKRQVTFTGTPVTLTHQDAKLTCRRAIAQTDAGGKIVSALCQGDVTFVRGERRVTCERATFDGVAERLVCDGNPVLHDGGSVARGARLVYELRANEVRLEGEKGKPVVGTLPGAEVEARRKALEAERARRRQEAGR